MRSIKAARCVRLRSGSTVRTNSAGAAGFLACGGPELRSRRPPWTRSTPQWCHGAGERIPNSHRPNQRAFAIALARQSTSVSRAIARRRTRWRCPLTRAERNRRYEERRRRGLVQPRERAPQSVKPSPAVEQINQLIAAVRAPKLPGALCRNRAALFDEAEHGEDPAAVAERHERAAAVCQLCPALGPCSQWAASLPPRQRPPGVLAGQIPNRGGNHE